MTRPQLVLDIGGVLATNLSPLFWQLLASEAAVSEEALYTAYKQQVSERLWTGQISEEQFWSWIYEHAPAVAASQARAFIDRCLQPLPALAQVAEWSAIADIHVLSNHLAAWVAPIINPIKQYVKSITISSDTGLRKPQSDIYAHVINQLPAGCMVLFVDDQDKNIRQAASLGWRTLLADQDGLWISSVLPILQNHREQEKHDTGYNSKTY